MKSAEVPRGEKTDKKRPNRKHEDIARRSNVKVSDTQHEHVADGGVEKSP
jgi:hypothetical protein